MTGILTYEKFRAALSVGQTPVRIIGKILDINEDLGFEATSIEESEDMFHAIVDAYVERCEKEGKEPMRSYSGKMQLRMPPELHRQIVMHAEAQKRALNSVLVEAVEDYVKEHQDG